MKRRPFWFALIVLVLSPLSAFAADISGTWQSEFDTQIGKQSYTFTFVVNGAMLTGTAKSANGESAIVDGKVDGNNVSFIENLTYQGMELKITYTGTIVSDDEISFSRNVMDLAKEPLTAKRVK